MRGSGFWVRDLLLGHARPDRVRGRGRGSFDGDSDLARERIGSHRQRDLQNAISIVGRDRIQIHLVAQRKLPNHARGTAPADQSALAAVLP